MSNILSTYLVHLFILFSSMYCLCSGRGKHYPRSTLASAPRGHFLLCSPFCTKPPPPLPPSQLIDLLGTADGLHSRLSVIYLHPGGEGDENPQFMPIWNAVEFEQLCFECASTRSYSLPPCIFITLIFSSGSHLRKIERSWGKLVNVYHLMNLVIPMILW